MLLTEKLQNIVDEYEKLEGEMTYPETLSNPEKMKILGQKLSSKKELYHLAKLYTSKQKNIHDLSQMQKDSDQEIAAMAKTELTQEEEDLKKLEEKVKVALLPKDPNDSKDVIMEIRPAAGGEESALFAGEYVRAIFRYAEEKGFTIELMSKNDSESGGIKEIIFAVRGEGAYEKLKYESGVHRVQRIPKTESQGRVHTSTITCVVLPEVDEIEFKIDPADVRVDVFRSSGPGGQSVNTTDSAVRLTHEPSGIVVICQDEKSQLKNKNRAFSVLRARLYAIEEEKRQKKEGEARLAQVGSGDRSEKIRTYNFPQDRVTDHRIKQNFSNLPAIMEGRLSPIIEAIHATDMAQKMQTMD